MDASTHSLISNGPVSLGGGSDHRGSIQKTKLAQDKRNVIRENMRALGATLERLYQVDETRCFRMFLHAIDDADGKIRRSSPRLQIDST